MTGPRRWLTTGGAAGARARRGAGPAHRSAFVVAFLAAAFAMALVAGPVLGHAALERTDPADGAVLGGPPREIRLEFGAPILVDLSSIEVTDGRGGIVAIGSVHGDPADPLALVADLPGLAPGAYRVSWRIVAAEDLHVSRGTLVFGVGVVAAGAGAGSIDQEASPLDIGIHWVDLVALAALLGALLVAWTVLLPLAGPAGGVDSSALTGASRRVLRLATGAGALALATGFGLILVESAEAAPAGAGPPEALAIVLGTPTGAGWLVREAACVVLLLVAAAGWRSPLVGSGRRRLVAGSITLVAGAALAVAVAGGSHAAQTGGPLSPTVLALAVHLVAAAAWTGGLAAVVVATVPLLRAASPTTAGARAILRRFGGLAAVGVASLAVSGLLVSGGLVASPDALLRSAYGQALLAKGALFLVVGVVGFGHALGLHPALRHAVPGLAGLRRPTRWPRVGASLAVELLGGAAILAVASSLASTPPARGPAWDPAPVAPGAVAGAGGAAGTTAVTGTAADRASAIADDAEPAAQLEVTRSTGDLIVSVTIRPNRPGPNLVEVGVHDTRRPAPAPIGSVAVRLTDPAGTDLALGNARDLGGGQYEASLDDLSVAGPWHVSVDVARSGLADTVTVAPWTVLPPLAPAPATRAARPVLVSDRPLAPLVDALAGLVALTAVAIAFLVRRGRAAGRRRAPVPAGSTAPR